MATTEVTSVVSSDTATTLNADSIVQKIYLAIGICGVLDNLFVAIVLLTSKALRQTRINMFIINQSLIDFAASAFIIATNFGRDVTIANTRIGRESMCRIWLTNLPIWGLFFSSTFNIVLMTLDRYLALVHPFKHAANVTNNRSVTLMIIVWLIGPGFYASYIIPTSHLKDQNSCSVFSKWPSAEWQTAAWIIISIVYFWLPLVVIVYSYARIFLVLRQSQNNAANSTSSSNRDIRVANAKKNVIKTLGMVSVCFLICWSGNSIYLLLYAVGYQVNFNSVLYHLTVVAVFMNSFINPIVYAVKYDPFKKRVRYLVCPKRFYEANLELSVITDCDTLPE